MFSYFVLEKQHVEKKDPVLFSMKYMLYIVADFFISGNFCFSFVLGYGNVC